MYRISINHKDGAVDYDIFTEEEAKEKEIEYKYWKDADKGDWAISDDGYVAQVIKRKVYPSQRSHSNVYIRLPWGYVFYSDKYPSKKFNAEGRRSFHTLTGKSELEVLCNKKPQRRLAMAFAQMRDFDLSIDWAMGSVSGAHRKKYHKMMRTEVFQRMVREELEKLLQDHDLSQDYTMELLKKAVKIAENKKDVTNILRIVENLQDMHGMKEKQQTKTTTQLTATMTRKMLDEIEEEERRLIASETTVHKGREVEAEIVEEKEG